METGGAFGATTGGASAGASGGPDRGTGAAELEGIAFGATEVLGTLPILQGGGPLGSGPAETMYHDFVERNSIASMLQSRS